LYQEVFIDDSSELWSVSIKQKSFILSLIYYMVTITRRTRRRISGGVKCHTPREIITMREKIINLWGKNGWKVNGNNKRTVTISDTFIYGREILPHHPVIHYAMNQGFSLEDALLMYCGKQKLGKPEYNDILAIINTYIQAGHVDVPQIIKRIGNGHYKKGNILEPSFWQMFILHYFIDTNEYKRINQLHLPSWTKDEVWHEYLDIFGSQNNQNNILQLDTLGSSHDEDLDKRARLVAIRVINNPTIQSIHTIDGHGRLIVRIVREILRLKPRFFRENPHFDVFVYNIDEEAHIWHQMTLPNGCAKSNNIFDVLNTSIKTNDIKSQLFYLNLSGLMGQGDRIRDSFVELFKKPENMKNLIVSFAASQNGREPAFNLVSQLIEFNELLETNGANDYVIETKTNRTDFFTFATKHDVYPDNALPIRLFERTPVSRTSPTKQTRKRTISYRPSPSSKRTRRI
jgi:hypothetical protein